MLQTKKNHMPPPLFHVQTNHTKLATTKKMFKNNNKKLNCTPIPKMQ
jgi:hypothetical protein